MGYQLTNDRLVPAEYTRTVHDVTVPAEVSPEECLAPGFWAHVASKLRVKDVLVVQSETLTWYMELYVLQAGHLYAKVGKLQYVEFDPNAIKEQAVVMGEYTIEFTNITSKYRVRRGKDVLKDKFASRAEAQAFLDSYLKNAAA